MRLLPAIDLLDGACVRLYQGDFSTAKVYHRDPLAVAQAFEAEGAACLHLVDLDGARAGKVQNVRLLERICAATRLRVDFGGGIQGAEDLRAVFDAGAAQANIGSVAVRNPEKFRSWLEVFGSDRLILSADVREGKVMTRGWQQATPLQLHDLINLFLPDGLAYLACTDILKDGALGGPAIDLYAGLKASYPGLFLTASGGVSSLQDLKDLKQAGCDAVIFGKALYEGAFTLRDALAAVSS